MSFTHELFFHHPDEIPVEPPTSTQNPFDVPKDPRKLPLGESGGEAKGETLVCHHGFFCPGDIKMDDKAMDPFQGESPCKGMGKGEKTTLQGGKIMGQPNWHFPEEGELMPPDGVN